MQRNLHICAVCLLSPPEFAGWRFGLRRVFVEGFELMGSVGVTERERRYEQRVVVSLDLEVVDTYDGRSDAIEDVYDYDRAIGIVKAAVAAGHVDLIETLAERIAADCLTDGQVLCARVRIEKPDVVPDCRAVGIEIVRCRPTTER
ncbi:MAG: dihydroneopterin aldolase [Hyphomicrobiaceae bacterium]